MKLDFQGLPLAIDDPVIFADYGESCLRTGTVTGLSGIYVTVLADGLWTTFRLLPTDIISVNSLSLKEVT